MRSFSLANWFLRKSDYSEPSVTHRTFRIPITNYSLICKLQHRSYLSLTHTHKALENILTSCRLSTVVYGFFNYLQRDNTLLHKPMYHITFWRNNEILMQVILSDICARKAPFVGRRQRSVCLLKSSWVGSTSLTCKQELREQRRS